MARSLTLQDYRDLTRTWFDLDEEDLPDILIDTWVQEGFDLAVVPELSWLYYQHTISFATVPGVNAYSLSDGTDELHTLYAAYTPRGRIAPTGHFSAQSVFTTESNREGEPVLYSVWNDQVYLWPTPNAVYNITVDGWRKPQDWIADGAGGVPDCPTEFHRPILTWVKAKAYFQQDDPEVAAQFEKQFSSQLQAIHTRFIADQAGVPIVMNKGKPLTYLDRLWYDWE